MSNSCNPTDCSLPDSSVHGIFQERILEWVALSFSRESSWPRDLTQVSCIAGGFLTDWATREALYSHLYNRVAKSVFPRPDLTKVVSSKIVQLLSYVRLFVIPWTAANQASLSITNTQSLLKLMCTSQWSHPIISSSVGPFSFYLQSFPASGSFQWVTSSHQVAKVLELQLQHQSCQWIFRLDFL